MMQIEINLQEIYALQGHQRQLIAEAASRSSGSAYLADLVKRLTDFESAAQAEVRRLKDAGEWDA